MWQQCHFKQLPVGNSSYPDPTKLRWDRPVYNNTPDKKDGGDADDDEDEDDEDDDDDEDGWGDEFNDTSSVIYIYYMLFLIVQISVSKTTKSFFDTYLYNYLKKNLP